MQTIFSVANFSVPLNITEKYILESASRLLFETVSWIKVNIAFKLFDINVQIILLQKHWCELFTIGLCQCSNTMGLLHILSLLSEQCRVNLESRDPSVSEHSRTVDDQIFQIQNYVNECEQLQLTSIEFAYLKLASVFDSDALLFNSSAKESDGFSAAQRIQYSMQREKVKAFQTLAFKELREMTNKTHPYDPERFIRIFQLAPVLKKLSVPIVEELFFNGLIGNLKIDHLIPVILKQTPSNPLNSACETSLENADSVSVNRASIESANSVDLITKLSEDNVNFESLKANNLLSTSPSSTTSSNGAYVSAASIKLV